MSHMLMSKDTMMSVREMPWHRLGAVLDDYPTSIEDALQKSGLSWSVKQGDVLVTQHPGKGDVFEALAKADEIAAFYGHGRENTVQFHDLMREYREMREDPTIISKAPDYRANLRADDGSVLGIVSEDYKVVQNEEAFRFLDALIMSDLHFETAGSLMNGRRVWVLARLPEWIEIGGDQAATFVYVTNSHDGTMAVTAAATTVRIVCANTLNYALMRSESGKHADRVFKFRHTGNLAVKFEEARKVMNMTVDYSKAMKSLGDTLAAKTMTVPQFENVLVDLFPIDTDKMGDRAIRNRKDNRLLTLDIFRGKGKAGDTRGNAPGTAWTAVNAIAEFADWNRRYTKNTDQVQRSFEGTDIKQQGLERVMAAVA